MSKTLLNIPFPTPRRTLPSPPFSLPPRISIFEIPLLLDLVCSPFHSGKEFKRCPLVSRPWRELFLPQTHRFVRFADLNVAQTWAAVDYAHCIRDLEIDIKDAGLFLVQEPSTNPSTKSDNRGDNSNNYNDETTSPWRSLCKNLETLSCVDFGYFDLPPR